MSGKSILNKVFDALQLSVDANVNCELTPRQCKELLAREQQLQDNYNSFIDARKEIARLLRLLELERSNE
jgi:hypothetical protein